MNETIKLAVLGGSSVATPELIRVLAQPGDRPPMEVVLLGRSESRLEPVATLSARLAASASAPITVRGETDLRRGLEGADYVLNQVRVGGQAARAHDESFPHAFGLPGEETFGPGGMSNARRTIPVTLEHCRLVEQVAPEALLINLTNPSSYIQSAIARYTRVNVVGVCDVPVGLAQGVARLLGAAPADLWLGYIGMHHFGWVTEVRWRGRDVMPEILTRAAEMPGLAVDVDIVRAVGAIPCPYFKYYYHPERMLARQTGQKTRAEQLQALEERLLADYASGDLDHSLTSLAARNAHWYSEIVVPVLLAHVQDARSIFVLNVTNGATVPWLPPETIVELPAVVTRHGFYPLPPPAAPPDVQAMLQVNAACEGLWVEAVVERSFDKALRAIRLHPLVQNLDQARAILKAIWT